jgi:hypothetical protein
VSASPAAAAAAAAAVLCATLRLPGSAAPAPERGLGSAGLLPGARALSCCARPRPQPAGEGCQIINKEGVKEANREEQGWIIKDNIIVVCKDARLAPGTII